MRPGSLILWCYLIWYLIVVTRYFDPAPGLWLTSLGLSGIIGFALLISTTAAGKTRVKLECWQVIRLFLMPFCVSSFAALVRGKGFVLVFSPKPSELLAGAGLCLGFCAMVFAIKRAWRPAIAGSLRESSVR